jgi:hypothetical protein
MPSLRFLHHSANHAHFHVDNGGADARVHAPFAEADEVLGGDFLESLRSKESPRLNQQLFLFLPTRIAQVQAPPFEKSVSGLTEGQSPELLTHWREFALRGLRDEFLLLLLSLSIIGRVQRLPEPLTINEEMCVPRLTAFFEGHVAGLLSSASEIVSRVSSAFAVLDTAPFPQPLGTGESNSPAPHEYG